MRKFFTSLVSLIIFIAILGFGIVYYINVKIHEVAENTITLLKANGFELSSYESLEIDYFNRSARLKNLKIASDKQIAIKLTIEDVLLEDINPISGQSVSIENSIVKNVELTYYGENYKFETITANGLKLGYKPNFKKILNVASVAEKIRIFHQELGYNSLSFTGFSLVDNLGKTSSIAEGSYSKTALINDLPSQWKLLLTGVLINQSHLAVEYAQMLKNYNIDELNGIFDISFDYLKGDNVAIFAVNNLNFGGLANLQAEFLLTMNDKRLTSLYEFDKLDASLNAVPIEHVEINYQDLGLYNYFITQQATLLNMSEAALRAQIYFGINVIGSGITNLDRRRELQLPVLEFVRKPEGLSIELSPAKPVRFSQYLNVYNLDILVRDLNPSIKYIEK